MNRNISSILSILLILSILSENAFCGGARVSKFIELDLDAPAEATHELEGRRLLQRVDAAGRSYYIDVETGKRVATAGRFPEPLDISDREHSFRPPLADTDERGAVPEIDISEEDKNGLGCDVPATLEIEVYALAVSALASLFGRVDRGPHSARKHNRNQVIFTYPGHNGDARILITFPERVPIDALPYVEEE